MSGRGRRSPRLARGVRFLVEVAFLAGLAALAAVARMHTPAVIAVMAFGWIVVALAEWSAWLDRPHFGRGLPPRYYVPQTLLPPPLPIEQTSIRPPTPRRGAEEEETRIAAAASWPASLEEWPSLDPDELGEDTEGAVEPPGEDAADLSAAEPTAIVAPLAAGGEAPAAPAEQPAARDTGSARLDTVPREVARAAPQGVSPQDGRPARHRIDPFTAAAPRSRLGRRPAARGTVELPARPPADRPPPPRPDSSGGEP
jgi:hypothetical protein